MIGDRATCLVADVGGTHCRFGIARADGSVEPLIRFRTADARGPSEAVARALSACPQLAPHGIALAVASPVFDDEVRMVNAAWSFSIAETASALGLPLLVTNDLVAVSYALATPVASATRPIGPHGFTAPDAESGTRVVLAAGTGLGIGILVSRDGEWHALPSEGGHMTAAASDALEDDLLGFARTIHPHVSWERLLSGSGLELLFRWVADRHGAAPARRDAAWITAHPADPTSRRAIASFSALLGTVAADLALTTTAFGGVYLTGGVLEHLGGAFDEGAFRTRFEAKGRYSALLARIPTFRLEEPHAALRGLGHAFERATKGPMPTGCRGVGFKG